MEAISKGLCCVSKNMVPSSRVSILLLKQISYCYSSLWNTTIVLNDDDDQDHDDDNRDIDDVDDDDDNNK